MDEELLELMYSESKIADSGVSKEEYSKFLMEDEELRNSAYSEMGFKSQGISTEDFNNMLGLGKKKTKPNWYKKIRNLYRKLVHRSHKRLLISLM